MADAIYFEVGQSIRAASGNWYRHIQHLGTGVSRARAASLERAIPSSSVSTTARVNSSLHSPVSISETEIMTGRAPSSSVTSHHDEGQKRIAQKRIWSAAPVIPRSGAPKRILASLDLILDVSRGRSPGGF